MPRPWLPAATFLFITIAIGSAALAAPPSPKLVRVPLGPALRVEQLLQSDLDVVFVKSGAYAEVLDWPGDEARLARLGASWQVIDENPSETAARRAAAELSSRPRPAPARVKSAARPDGTFRIETLPPFGSGSMGGYWTLAEVKMELDSLVANDPNDIVADKLDTLGTTWQGRPIWGLKLGKRVTGPDPRPVAFYNALTHAREPESMQTLFYFVHDLLSKYGTDPIATYLLNQRVIYIVPVVNPDGYEINRTNFPGGGGLHRKNGRDNDNNGTVEYRTDGVDINRNYGFKWGLDDVGSSPSTTSDIYRGPSAFSEPETQSQRNIIQLIKPKSGLSFHTYSDLFLNPWGYQDTATPDSNAFYEYDDVATLRQGYQSGQATRVLYSVNGEFNDWAYGDTISKPKAFTWTPEIGNQADGFWPPPSRIVPLAQENLRECYFVAQLAGPFVRVDDFSILEGHLDAGNAAHIAVRARNLGLAPTGTPLTAHLTVMDAGTEVLNASDVPYPSIGVREDADASGGATFWVAAADTVTPGRPVHFLCDFSTPDGATFSRDTIEVLVGKPSLLVNEFGSTGLTNWTTTGGWGIVIIDPTHPSRYYADSPFGPYAPSADAKFTLRGSLNLSAGVHAWALFEDKWFIETDFDAASVEASLDSVNWIGLPGLATRVAPSLSVLPGHQIYQGNRYLWHADRVDLSAFTGPAASHVRLRFRMTSDPSNQFDGIDFDSLRVLFYDPANQAAPVAVGGDPKPARLELASPAPNPVRGLARFEFALPVAGAVRLEIFDPQGRRVSTLASAVLPANRYVRGWDLRDDEGRAVAPGIYLARLSGAAGVATRRFVVLR